VVALGFWSRGDGGGGLFQWDSTSAAADDSGLVIQPTGGTTGRWKRVYDRETVNVNWFGATNTSDLAAQINAASAALGAPGTIVVSPGNYTLSGQVILQAGQSLHLGAGKYTCNREYPNGAVFVVNSNCSISGDGPSTVITEPHSYQVVGPAVSWNVPGTQNVTVRDLQIVPVDNLPPQEWSTQLPNIGAGNGLNWQISNIHWNGTNALAFSFGDSSDGGYCADGGWVTDCVIEGVRSINSAVVNGQNIHIERNTWRNIGGGAYGACLALDLEPNEPTDTIKNIIIANNIVDFRGATEAAGIAVQGQSSTASSGPVVVANNTFIANNTVNQATGCIGAAGSANVIITGNTMNGYYSQTPISLFSSSRCLITSNIIKSSGSGCYVVTINDNCTYNTVSNNVIQAGSDVYGGLPGINESTNGCDYNYFFNNIIGAAGDIYDSLAALPVVNRNGAHSRKYNNIIAGVLDPGDAAPSFDIVGYDAGDPGAISAGNYTTGTMFYLTAAGRVWGINFFWNDTVTGTVNATLYSYTGSILGTASIAVSGVGKYGATFTTPISVPLYTACWAAIRESTGTKFQAGTGTTYMPALPFVAGGGLVLCDSAYASGSALPSTSVAASYRYPVSPSFTIP
jgi:hypothetical protein